MRRFRFLILLLFLAGLAPATSAQTTHTLTVNTTTLDDRDLNPGDGVCNGLFGLCNYRAAIQEANALPPEDHILIRFDLPVGSAITYEHLLPTLSHDHVTIDGTTHPDASCGSLIDGTPHTLVVAIDGSKLDEAAWLAISGDHVTVRGLNFRNFPASPLRSVGQFNTFECNYFGTTLDGTAAAANGTGLWVEGGHSTVSNNLISGNTGIGLSVGEFVDSADNIVVQGNLIGTDVTGTQAIGNGRGIDVGRIQGSVLIGGTAPGQRNVISGNDDRGIWILGGTGYRIEGNYIGTDRTGTAAIGNDYSIYISSDAGHIVGGTAPGAGNLISGHHYVGVYLGGGGHHRVEGNTIGPDVTGTTSLSIGATGIRVRSSYNVIGGTAPGAGNLISGNSSQGINIEGSIWYRHNRIEGNTIGTNADGTAALYNGHGIWIIDADSNVVGGTTPGAGNLISGNANYGVSLTGDARHNRIEGNTIGTNADGTAALPNKLGGIILSSADSNVVGGLAPGAGNLISGNTGSGVYLTGNSTNYVQANRIAGNRIGTNADGTAALPNQKSGIQFGSYGHDNVIGGTDPGAGNLISGNGFYGIILSPHSDAGILGSNRIEGNYIGTNAGGTAALPNGATGVFLEHSSHDVVLANVISGNTGSGVLLSEKAQYTRVEGNYIGTNAQGTAAIPNSLNGVQLNKSHGSIVHDNVISGNLRDGIRTHIDAQNLLIQANRIGTNADGTNAVPNHEDGIVLSQGSGHLVGGTDPGQGNLISGNAGHGISLSGLVTQTSVRGNLIGTDVTGTAPLPNAEAGVILTNVERNSIGGTAPGTGNTIAFNGAAGIAVTGTAKENALLRNRLFQNGTLGIDLGDDGLTLNDAGDADIGTHSLQNFPVLTSAVNDGGPTAQVRFTLDSTPSQTYRVELFSSPAFDPSGFGEGQTFVAAVEVTTDAGGTASFDGPVPAALMPAGSFLTATASRKLTATAYETSELSAAVPVTGSGGGALTLSTRVFLQGSFAGGSMRTTLRDNGLLPTLQPYTAAPWTYAGPEAVTAFPADAVDWVLVELRATSDGPAIARKAGLLLADGSITHTDGVSPLPFSGVGAGSYFVVVRHRNHLPVMSATAVDFASGTATYSFTEGVGTAFGTGAMVEIGGRACLWSGDGSADGQVTAPDFNVFNADTAAGTTGYLTSDYDLNGQVTAPDFNVFNANTAAGAASKVPED